MTIPTLNGNVLQYSILTRFHPILASVCLFIKTPSVMATLDPNQLLLLCVVLGNCTDTLDRVGVMFPPARGQLLRGIRAKQARRMCKRQGGKN